MKAFVGILIIINSLILFFLNIIRIINQFDGGWKICFITVNGLDYLKCFITQLVI